MRFKVPKLQMLTVHSGVTRILAVVSTVYYYLFFVRSSPLNERFTVKYLLYSGSIALLLNGGLLLSTMKWGACHRVLLFLLLLPALTAAPMVLWFFDQSFGGWLIMVVTIWSYWVVARRERLFYASS